MFRYVLVFVLTSAITVGIIVATVIFYDDTAPVPRSTDASTSVPRPAATSAAVSRPTATLTSVLRPTATLNPTETPRPPTVTPRPNPTGPTPRPRPTPRRRPNRRPCPSQRPYRNPRPCPRPRPIPLATLNSTARFGGAALNSCRLSPTKEEKSTPATTKVIRSYIPRFGGPLLKKCESWLQPVRM